MSRREGGVGIIGASVAGVRCARSLRSAGYAGRVVLVEAEDGDPYDRPPLSKELLSEGGAVRSLVTREALGSLDVELRSGERATGLDPATGLLVTSVGEDRFEEVVVATGAVPRTLSNLPGGKRVLTLRDLPSSRALRAVLAPSARLVVVGGGWIGLEVAAAAIGRGARVSIVESGPQILGRGVAPVVAEHLAALHSGRGVDVRTSVTVTESHVKPSYVELRLSDGTVLRADVVLVAVGARPATDWLAGSGLRLEVGIVCDDQLRAEGARRVSAIGDCASWVNPTYGARMRLEHWTSAGEQAAHVARRLAGRAQGKGCAILPYVWSDQYDVHVQTVGVPGTDRLVMEDPRAALTVLECRGQDVVGASTINGQALMLRLRSSLRSGPISRADLVEMVGFGST